MSAQDVMDQARLLVSMEQQHQHWQTVAIGRAIQFTVELDATTPGVCYHIVATTVSSGGQEMVRGTVLTAIADPVGGP